MTIQFKIVNPLEDKRWDEYVENHPQGTIYHHSSWCRVLASTYGYEPFYVALQREGGSSFEGVVPFMLVDSWLTGKRLVSLPFTTYCNPLVNDSEIEKTVQFILARHPGIDYIELKILDGKKMSYPSIFAEDSSYIGHVLDIDHSLDSLLRSFHSTSVRQRIIKSGKNDLSVRMADSENDIIIFFKLHTEVRKKHALPPLPYRFFLNMWRILAPKGMLFVPLIEHSGKVVSAAIVLKFKETVHFEYSATGQDYFKLCANQMLIWEIIKKASNESIKCFDFGRSSLTNQSLVRFKDRWSAKKYSLTTCYFPKTKKINLQKGGLRKTLDLANRCLPSRLLQIEANLLYHHLG